jgi:hypothetical protein
MQEIAELERRIASALDRIARRLDDEGAVRAIAAADLGADFAASAVLELQLALDEERMINAQLSERQRVVKDKNADEKAQIALLTEQLGTAISQRDATLIELQSALAATNDELFSLRHAAVRGTTMPHQINRALLAEVEALRALRTADAAGISAVLAEIEPILKGAESHA